MKRLLLIITLLTFTVYQSSAQWLNQSAGFTVQTRGFYEFSIVDQNTVWAICYDGIGGLFGPYHVLDFTRTTDGGTTWVPGTMGSDTSLAFSNICALSDSEAWVAMHKFQLNTGGGLFHTTDAGATWTQAPPFDSLSFPNWVYFKDTEHGIAGGDANGGYFEIYTTDDGGVNWTRVPQANIPAPLSGGQYGWFDGYAVLGDTVWFGTNLGQMYKSTDFGQTWNVSTVDPSGRMVYEIAFNDDGLHGLSHVRSNTATFLFSTSDGGATWTQLPSHPKWKQSRITSVPGTNTFVSTSTNNNATRGSAYTNDNGVTWVQIENVTQKAACRFLNSTTGWAGSYFIPFSPQGGIHKWDNTYTVSLDEHNPDLSANYLWPNPASDVLNIHLADKKAKLNLGIFNTSGELVKEIHNSAFGVISIEELPAGLYVLRSVDDASINLRFVKVDR